jgi:hypothetical protein
MWACRERGAKTVITACAFTVYRGSVASETSRNAAPETSGSAAPETSRNAAPAPAQETVVVCG